MMMLMGLGLGDDTAAAANEIVHNHVGNSYGDDHGNDMILKWASLSWSCLVKSIIKGFNFAKKPQFLPIGNITN